MTIISAFCVLCVIYITTTHGCFVPALKGCKDFTIKAIAGEVASYATTRERRGVMNVDCFSLMSAGE